MAPAGADGELGDGRGERLAHGGLGVGLLAHGLLVEVQRRGPGGARELGQDLVRQPAPHDELAAGGAHAGAQVAQALQQEADPVPLGLAEAVARLGRVARVEHVGGQQAPVGAGGVERVEQRRVVVEAEVVAEPEEGGRHGAAGERGRANPGRARAGPRTPRRTDATPRDRHPDPDRHPAGPTPRRTNAA